MATHGDKEFKENPTYGSKKFEEQAIMAYIKEKYCQSGDECFIAIHPPKIPGTPEHRTCRTCSDIFSGHYKEVKSSMEFAQARTVRALIKASCRIGSCRTGVHDCGICGERDRNIKATTKEYFELQHLACMAYIQRVYGVPRHGQGYENASLDNTQAAFFANWRPFANEKGNFACNFPGLYLRMVNKNAPELQTIIFPYEVKPWVEPDTGVLKTTKKVVHVAKDVSENVIDTSKRASQHLITNAKDVSETLLSTTKNVSENLLDNAKEGTKTLVEDTAHVFRKEGAIRQSPSFVSTKTSSLLHKGIDKVKGLKPRDDQFRSRRFGRLGSQLSRTMSESKEKIREVSEALKEKLDERKVKNRPRGFGV